jgi:hypothetical protein
LNANIIESRPIEAPTRRRKGHQLNLIPDHDWHFRFVAQLRLRNEFPNVPSFLPLSLREQDNLLFSSAHSTIRFADTADSSARRGLEQLEALIAGIPRHLCPEGANFIFPFVFGPLCLLRFELTFVCHWLLLSDLHRSLASS